LSSKETSTDEQERDEAYTQIIMRLDAGVRQYIMGHFLSTGDSLASSPNKTATALLFILWAYATGFGTTDSGQADLADEKTFNKAVELINDLSLYLRATEAMSKVKTPEEWKLFVQQPLRRLEDKYSQKASVQISNNPTLLEQTIIGEVFKIYPKTVSQLTNLLAINSRGGFINFNAGNVLRFNFPTTKSGPST